MKNKIRFKIDEKSLFLGTYNDYKKGQTATVSTPLNQSKDESKWRNDILALSKYNCNIINPPEMLIHQCQSASHSGDNIDNILYLIISYWMVRSWKPNHNLQCISKGKQMNLLLS